MIYFTDTILVIMADQPSEEPVPPAAPEAGEQQPDDGRGEDPAPADTQQSEETKPEATQEEKPQTEVKHFVMKFDK